jgi:hypothetical protein
MVIEPQGSDPLRPIARSRVAEDRGRAKGTQQGENPIPHTRLRLQSVLVRHWKYLLT